MSDLNERPSGDMKKKTGLYVAALLLVTVAAVIAGVIIHGVPAIRQVNREIFETGDEINAGEMKTAAGDLAAAAGDLAAAVGDLTAEAGNISVRIGDETESAEGTGRTFSDGSTSSAGDSESWSLPAGEQVSCVEIEADLINLYLVTGDSFHAEWDNAEEISYVNFDIKNDTLEIREKRRKGISLNFSLKDLGMNLSVPELKLTVPESVCLEGLEIDVDCGNVVIAGISSRKTEIEASCGNIELKKAAPGDLEIQADCGNIDLDQTAAGNAVLQADLGRVEVLESSFSALTAHADCGVIECRRITADRVELDADCGNIEVSGDYGSLKADCDLGNIEAETDRPETEVRLELDAEVGNVTVNGKKR